MGRWVHDAQRITDSDTAASRCSRSLAPKVWFLLPPTTSRDNDVEGFPLLAAPRELVGSAVLVSCEDVAARPAAVVASSEGTFFSPELLFPDGDWSGSSDPRAQKNEKLGIDTTGDGKTASFSDSGSLLNENPEAAQDGAGASAAENAEKDDLQVNVGEQGVSNRLWQVTGPPVLKLTSRLCGTSGMENEHAPGSSLLRLISWQWPQESRDSSECSCIQECSRTCSAVSLCLGSRRSIPAISSLAEPETLFQGTEGNRSSVDLIHSNILDFVFPQNGGMPLKRMYSITPELHTSAASVYPPESTSGAM